MSPFDNSSKENDPFSFVRFVNRPFAAKCAYAHQCEGRCESQEAVIDAWLATETDRNEVVPRRIDAISKELATIVQHDWAGEYRSGMPLGDYVTIVIAPDSGIGRTTFGCCGEGKPNCGRTRIDDLGVHVHWDYPCHPSFPEPRILVPIRWGDSRFLIPQNEISLFSIDAREHHRKNEPKAHSRRLTTRYLGRAMTTFCRPESHRFQRPIKHMRT